MLFACYYHRPWPPGQVREPVASGKINVEVPDSTNCSKCSGTFFFSIFNGLFSVWELKPLSSDPNIPLLERIACSEKSVSFYILILPWNVTTCAPKWTRVQASLHLLSYYCARLQVPKHSCFLASQEIAPEIGPAVWVAYKLPCSYRSRWDWQKNQPLLLYTSTPHSSGLRKSPVRPQLKVSESCIMVSNGKKSKMEAGVHFSWPLACIQINPLVCSAWPWFPLLLL